MKKKFLFYIKFDQIDALNFN